MRINFVVNTTGSTGGIKVVFQYANALKDRGHDVRIIYPYDLSRKNIPAKEGWTALLKMIKYSIKSGTEWFPLNVPVMRVFRIEAKYLPDADIIVATANETADWVAVLPDCCGSKFYFIQHYEDWSRDPSLVKATWKLPLKKIVVAKWLETLASTMGEKVIACVPNGIDPKEFYATDREEHQPIRILAMAHILPWKGTQDAVDALNSLRKRGVEFEATFFGDYYFDPGVIPGSRFVRSPHGETLRRLYGSNEIFLSSSWSEGFGLTPLEAMACGCVVVSTKVGGVPDYAKDDESALLVLPRQPEALAEALQRLIEDPELRRRLAEAGKMSSSSFNLANAAEKFERALIDHV